MINKKVLFILIAFILLNSCSFDNKTGIWGDSAKEKKRISELEKEQKEIIKVEKIYSSNKIFNKEVAFTKNIVLSKPQNKSSVSDYVLTDFNQDEQEHLDKITNNIIESISTVDVEDAINSHDAAMTLQVLVALTYLNDH